MITSKEVFGTLSNIYETLFSQLTVIVSFWEKFPIRDIWQSLNPIEDRLFRGCSRMGEGQKGPPSLKSVTHILQWWNLASYTLPKEDPKNIWITWHTPWILLTSIFFHLKPANFAISRNTDIDCILMHNFHFF